jgi:hypothetical protein
MGLTSVERKVVPEAAFRMPSHRGTRMVSADQGAAAVEAAADSSDIGGHAPER